MDNISLKIAEVSMIRAIPMTVTSGCPHNGRLKGLMSRLAEQTDQLLKRLPPISRHEYDKIILNIAKWGEKSGWDGKHRHITTFASFALDLIEHSQLNYPQELVNTLVDIVDYFDRNKKINPAPFWAGGIAYQKWVDIMGPYQEDVHV